MKGVLSAVFSLVMAVALCVSYTFAQTDTPRVIKGGVLNGKAVSLPKPEYPESARAAKIEGIVSVKVLIDEEGNVISAEPVTEPAKTARRVGEGDTAKVEMVEGAPPDPILLDAAQRAAMMAKFSPTLLSGVPVKVSGVISYNFVARRPAEIAPSDSLTRQAGTGTSDRLISGGVLNGKATSLPKPAYPPAAAAVRAEGSVSVQVTVDENGYVISAAAVSGHPLLRAASVEAARGALFSPTSLDGKAVKITGVITYVFVAPKEN